MHLFRLFLLCAFALTATACKDKLFNDFTGGSSSGANGARGTLVQNPPESRGVFTAAALLLQLGSDANQQLLTLGGNPLCDIAIYHLQYRTVGGSDEATTATGALMVPAGGDSKCTSARPILLYAHGTSTDKTFDISNVMNDGNGEGIILAAFFASQGYIVVAPNYAGYDTSTLSYHPYLIADQQSKDMIDALTAARSALPVAAASSTRDDGRLFLTGYSQGGYVAMATQRAMQAAGMTVTASAPLSGPYTLAAFVDAVFEGQVNGDAPISWTLLATGYQHAYGEIYSRASDVFESQYASGIDTLLPSTLARSDLFAQGKLPQNALLSSTPPDPSFANITPAREPANLATVFAQGFGSNNLVTNSYRLSYLTDAQANPDGAFPTTTTGVPAASPQLSIRARLKQNDLRTEWTPVAPTLLCAGNSDPVVFFMNTLFMQGFWASRAPAALSVVNIDSGSTGDPYDDLRSGFAAAKDLVAATAVAGGARDGGAAAVLEAYHTTLVAPFCVAAAAKFFAAQ
jgi:Prolyl oligopeptidase family